VRVRDPESPDPITQIDNLPMSNYPEDVHGSADSRSAIGRLSSRFKLPSTYQGPSDTAKPPRGIFTKTNNLWSCGTKDEVCKRPNVDSYLLTSPVTAVGVALLLLSTGRQYNPTQSGIKDSGCHEAHRGARPRHQICPGS